MRLACCLRRLSLPPPLFDIACAIMLLIAYLQMPCCHAAYAAVLLLLLPRAAR